MLVLRKPYLLYLGDAVLKSDCKTAFGLRDWCREDVLGEWSHPAATVTLDLPRLAPAAGSTRRSVLDSALSLSRAPRASSSPTR